MAEIASSSDISAKWARVTPQRTEDYRLGVEKPRKDWAQSTAAGAEAWKAGITQAIAANAFSKGVARAGSAKWQKGAVEKGTARWGPGVQVAQGAYEEGVAPYVEAIRRTTLPPRFARRDPRNLERVRVIVDALSKVKAARA
jgi:hypothetical protein